MSMRNETILVTGATGLIGHAVLRHLLATPGAVRHAHALVRDPRVWSAIASSLPNRGQLTSAVMGDITRPGLGLDAAVRAELVRTATMVIHCAADTSFSQTLEHARATNTSGTANI